MASSASTSFVEDLYRIVLLRSGSADEVAGWAAPLDAGQLTQAQIAQALESSNEAVDLVDPVERLYQTFLDRAPDAAGLQGWEAALRDGTVTEEQLAQGFVASQEFTSLFGANPDPASFVTALYRNVLGRAPDASGLAGWVGAIKGGMSLADVGLGFANSPELIAKMLATQNAAIEAATNAAPGTGETQAGSSSGSAGTGGAPATGSSGTPSGTASATSAASADAPPGMHLTFDDEFNGISTINGYMVTPQNVWKTTFYGGDRSLSGNHELEVYVDPAYKGSGAQALGLDPFSVQNGILAIHASPTPTADVALLGGAKYVSGLLTTQNSFAQTYGYFEMRAEVPAGKGLWPAFWLLPANGSWPPEIDVMEQIGSANNYISTGAIAAVGQTYNKGTYVAANTTSQGFHTYAVNWNASTITWYFDGQQIYQIATPADMNKPMYMLVNLAVGGTWPGSPDSTTNWAAANYQIDYVRAYSSDPYTNEATVTLSSQLNSQDLSSSFNAPATGAGTSTTYTAAQLGIAGVNPATTVTVAHDASNDLTITDNYTWGSILDALINTSNPSHITINNIVNTTVHVGDGDNVITINNAMQGSIVAGSGNNTIAVTAQSNAPSNNLMGITVADGNNHVSFSGGWNAMVSVKTGNGVDRVTFSGQAIASVLFGSGNDTLVDRTTGPVTATGGGGNNLYEFAAGAHATITNFNPSHDTIELLGAAGGSAVVATSGGSTTIDWTGGSTIQLVGLAASGSALHIVYG